MATDHYSDLARALDLRERRLYDAPTDDMLGLGERPVGPTKVRIVTKHEQDLAVLQAYQYVREQAKEAKLDNAVDDRDLLDDAKTAHVLWFAYRDPKDPKYPAFPGPAWMMKHMPTHEIARLLRFYREALRVSGAVETDLSRDRLEALAEGLAASASTDLPNTLLKNYSPEQVAEIAIRFAVIIQELKACTSESTTDPSPT